MSLDINNLHISIADKEIVKGLSLEIEPGQVHAIMGPNGSGKSTLANTLMGHPKYTVTEGKIVVDGNEITDAEPNERAEAGLFLSMQYPTAIEGVTITKLMKSAVEAKTGETLNPVRFFQLLQEKMKELNMDPSFAKRYVNSGFSGGEKKRAEILQLMMLDPTYAILDETDSGLDVDALKIVAEGINNVKAQNKGVLLITHYNRILQHVQPDVVHVMVDGKIVKSGEKELAEEIENSGYKLYTNK